MAVRLPRSLNRTLLVWREVSFVPGALSTLAFHRYSVRLAPVWPQTSCCRHLAISRRSRMAGWGGRTMAPWLKAVR